MLPLLNGFQAFSHRLGAGRLLLSEVVLFREIVGQIVELPANPIPVVHTQRAGGSVLMPDEFMAANRELAEQRVEHVPVNNSDLCPWDLI